MLSKVAYAHSNFLRFEYTIVQNKVLVAILSEGGSQENTLLRSNERQCSRLFSIRFFTLFGNGKDTCRTVGDSIFITTSFYKEEVAVIKEFLLHILYVSEVSLPVLVSRQTAHNGIAGVLFTLQNNHFRSGGKNQELIVTKISVTVTLRVSPKMQHVVIGIERQNWSVVAEHFPNTIFICYEGLVARDVFSSSGNFTMLVKLNKDVVTACFGVAEIKEFPSVRSFG